MPPIKPEAKGSLLLCVVALHRNTVKRVGDKGAVRSRKEGAVGGVVKEKKGVSPGGGGV